MKYYRCGLCNEIFRSELEVEKLIIEVTQHSTDGLGYYPTFDTVKVLACPDCEGGIKDKF